MNVVANRPSSETVLSSGGSALIPEQQPKVVILAGGLGTRISEESHFKPKPMIEIGGRPIIWHIMRLYSSFGLNDFVICCGYKGHMIRDFFVNYHNSTSDITVDFTQNSIEVHKNKSEPWRVTLIDTGLHTQTGGRLAQVKDYLGDTFCMTYGDGLSNVDMGTLLEFHREQGRSCTLTSVQPEARFGAVEMDEGKITHFEEKPTGDNRWINGGFFVCEKSVIDLVDGDECIWEQGPLATLAERGDLSAYKHSGFWMPMDTMRDKKALEALWESDDAPWKLCR